MYAAYNPIGWFRFLPEGAPHAAGRLSLLFHWPWKFPCWRNRARTSAEQSKTFSKTSCFALWRGGVRVSPDRCWSWERSVLGREIFVHNRVLKATHRAEAEIWSLCADMKWYLYQLGVIHQPVGFTGYGHHVIWEKVLQVWNRHQLSLLKLSGWTGERINLNTYRIRRGDVKFTDSPGVSWRIHI